MLNFSNLDVSAPDGHELALGDNGAQPRCVGKEFYDGTGKAHILLARGKEHDKIIRV
jgi:hypothetical protein